MFQLLVSLMLLCLPANYPASPIVDSTFVGDAIASVHADGSASLVGAVSLTEEVLVCSVANASQDDVGDPPVANLTTQWKDDSGSTQTVSTPIVSTTPGGLDRAIEIHRDLVRRMKVVYPPATP